MKHPDVKLWHTIAAAGDAEKETEKGKENVCPLHANEGLECRLNSSQVPLSVSIFDEFDLDLEAVRLQAQILHAQVYMSEALSLSLSLSFSLALSRSLTHSLSFLLLLSLSLPSRSFARHSM